MIYNQKKFEQLFKAIAYDAFCCAYNLPNLSKDNLDINCLEYDKQAYEKYKFLEGY